MRHKKHGWRALLAVVALAIAALAGGCGSSNSDSSAGTSGASTSSSSSATKVSGTLTFATSASSQPGWTQVIKLFKQKYPNVTVRPSFIPIATYNQLMTTQFQAGNAPDVFFTAAGTAYPTAIGTLSAAGKILDLSGRPSLAGLPDVAKKVATVNGKMVAVPMTAWTGFILYNADKFKELGLQVPTTVDELKSLCGTIAGKNLTPVALGPTTGDLGNFYAILAGSLVEGTEPDWITKRNAGQATFAGDQGWTDTFQTLVDMKNAKCFDPGVAGISRDAALASFADGKALMLPVLQNQMATVLATKPKFKYAAFAAPAMQADQRTMFAAIDPLISVNAKAKNKDAALAFVDFAATPAASAAYAKTQGVIPLGDFSNKQLPDYLQPLSKFLYKDNGSTALLMTSQFKSSSTFQTLSTDLVGLLTGQTKVDGLLQKLDDTYGK